MKRIISPGAFDKKYFTSGNYEEYEEIASQWVSVVARRVRKNLKGIQRPRVLDVGCAYGYFLVGLQEAGCDVAGIEYSPHAIRNAEKTVRRSIRKGSILQRGVAQANAFDAVTCFNVLEYVAEADVPKAIANLVRWSKNLIFFTTCFTHSRYASQKYSPDPLRTTVKTQRQWRELFAKSGAAYKGKFYDGGGGDVLVFRKK